MNDSCREMYRQPCGVLTLLINSFEKDPCYAESPLANPFFGRIHKSTKSVSAPIN